MAGRKKRQPSNKEAVGKTKSQILLFIADNQRCDYTRIREFLRSNLNIRNQKVIRGHLSGLISKDLIKKETRGKGIDNVYFISDNFSAFRGCFNFLHVNHFSLDFLKTRYAKDLIPGDDFFIYALINIFKDIFVNLYEVISDDKASNDLLNQYFKETNDSKNLEMMKQKIEEMRNLDIQSYINGIKTKSPEEIIDFLLTFFVEIKLDKKYIISLLSNIFPNDARKNITNIILSSPTAMDFFLNLTNQNKIIFFGVLLRFFLGELFVDHNKVQIIESFNKLKEKKLESEVMNLIPAFFNMSNVLNDNPMFTILRAYFIIDSMNNNVIENEYSRETLSKILIPEVKK
jgi:hypothetical protein